MWEILQNRGRLSPFRCFLDMLEAAVLPCLWMMTSLATFSSPLLPLLCFPLKLPVLKKAIAASVISQCVTCEVGRQVLPLQLPRTINVFQTLEKLHFWITAFNHYVGWRVLWLQHLTSITKISQQASQSISPSSTFCLLVCLHRPDDSPYWKKPSCSVRKFIPFSMLGSDVYPPTCTPSRTVAENLSLPTRNRLDVTNVLTLSNRIVVIVVLSLVPVHYECALYSEAAYVRMKVTQCEEMDSLEV